MTDTVHVEIPHLTNHALYEGAVNWSACSAVAIECAIAGREGRIPDAGNAKRTWQSMLNAGQTTGGGHGADIANCVWSLQQRGYHNLDVRFVSAGLDAVHQLLKDAGEAGDPAILLVTNGQALPDNERGVGGHFVVSAGIDSSLGYLLLNGDTQTAIAGQARYSQWPTCSDVPTHWAPWSTLVAAQLYAAIRVKSNTPAPQPTPAPAPTPPVPAPTAPTTPPQVAQALAAVEQASQALATAEAALKSL